MAYCPICKTNVQIVVSTETDTHERSETTEVYSKNDYDNRRYKVGEIDSNQTYTSIETIPRCSLCYRVLIYPKAQTANDLEKIYKEKFEKWKYLEISKLRNVISPYEYLSLKPLKINDFGDLIFMVFIVIILITSYNFFSTGQWLKGIIINFLIMVGVFLIMKLLNYLSDEDGNNNLPEVTIDIEKLKSIPLLKDELDKLKSSLYSGYDYDLNIFTYTFDINLKRNVLNSEQKKYIKESKNLTLVNLQYFFTWGSFIGIFILLFGEWFDNIKNVIYFFGFDEFNFANALICGTILGGILGGVIGLLFYLRNEK